MLNVTLITDWPGAMAGGGGTAEREGILGVRALDFIRLVLPEDEEGV